MADASSGGGVGGAPRPSTFPSAANLPPSASASGSLDGGLLLRLLQNPPPRPHQQQTPVQPLAEPHSFFVDPAVAPVGPLFPSPPHVHGGGFAWPSSSAPQPQPRFPDPRFAQPLDPYAERGGGGFGSMDGVARTRAEKPRSGAPPPGFGKPSPPGFVTTSHPAAGPEASNVFGGMQQNRERRREPNHHHPKGFGRTQNKEQQMMPPLAGGQGVLGRLPQGEQHTQLITGGRGITAGMMYGKQQQQRRQDHVLSRTPPDANALGIIGRMPRGEQHMPQFTGDRTLLGDQHIPPATGGRMSHRGQRQQEPCLTDVPQSEQRWQGYREEKGHASRNLPNANVHEMLGKMPMKERHQLAVPAGSSVDIDVREDRVKKMLTEVNGLEDDGVGEVGFEHRTDGRAVVEARNFEVSYQKSEVRFAGKNEEEDDGSKEEHALIEQFMDTMVIEGNGEAKGSVVQNSGSRSK